MPAWWGKKGRSKDSVKSSSVKNEKKRGKEIDSHRVNSLDEGLLQPTPRISRDFSAGVRELSGRDSSGFSGFDSASSLDKGQPQPLPRPLGASNDHSHGVGSGSGSGSVSSVSSSGSSDDHAQVAADQPAFRLVFLLFGAFFWLDNLGLFGQGFICLIWGYCSWTYMMLDLLYCWLMN